MMTRERHPTSGLTLLEATLAVAILSILAGAAFPLQTLVSKRSREFALRETLREVRRAIDRYRDEHSRMENAPTKETFTLVYPASLDELVIKGYLRRIPLDPMSNEREWKIIPFPGVHEEQGRVADAGGVFDVRSLSEETAIDGTRYDDW